MSDEMPKPKPERKAVKRTLYIRTDLYEKARAVAFRERLPMTRILNDALDAWLRRK